MVVVISSGRFQQISSHVVTNDPQTRGSVKAMNRNASQRLNNHSFSQREAHRKSKLLKQEQDEERRKELDAQEEAIQTESRNAILRNANELMYVNFGIKYSSFKNEPECAKPGTPLSHDAFRCSGGAR